MQKKLARAWQCAKICYLFGYEFNYNQPSITRGHVWKLINQFDKFEWFICTKIFLFFYNHSLLPHLSQLVKISFSKKKKKSRLALLSVPPTSSRSFMHVHCLSRSYWNNFRDSNCTCFGEAEKPPLFYTRDASTNWKECYAMPLLCTIIWLVIDLLFSNMIRLIETSSRRSNNCDQIYFVLITSLSIQSNLVISKPSTKKKCDQINQLFLFSWF